MMILISHFMTVLYNYTLIKPCRASVYVGVHESRKNGKIYINRDLPLHSYPHTPKLDSDQVNAS